MATLEKIRKRSGLLIVTIGVAMGAFLMMDLFTGGTSAFTGDQNTVGEIDGEKISYQQFSEKMDEIRMSNPQAQQMTTTQLSNEAWNMLIQEKLFGELFEDLGLTVGESELLERIIDNPNIKSMPQFVDPATGQFNRQNFITTIASVRDRRNESPEMAQQWAGWKDFENQVREQAITFKFNSLVDKGIYTPVALARHAHAQSSISSDVGFIQLAYSSVSDDEVEVTESDFKSYYNENRHKYKQETASRDLIFVNFQIEPSDLDRKEVYDNLESLIQPDAFYNESTGDYDTIPGFAATKDDSAFVVANSEIPYRSGYWRSGELSSNVDSVMFSAKIGDIYGPYEESGGYKLTKLTDIATLPDSVSARHILIAYQSQQNQQAKYTRAQAKVLADSLTDYLRGNMSDFDTLVTQYSDDQSSVADGGLYEWFPSGQMVAAFENFCFENAPKTLGVVETQFGFHIIEVVEHSASTQKAVKVATVFQSVNTSRRTEQEIYDKAAAFAAAASEGGFAKVADSLGYQARSFSELNAAAEQVPGLGMARPVVKWAFTKDLAEGDIELINNAGTAYVAVQVTSINEEGYKPLERVREEIRPMVINRAKAEQVLLPRAEAMMEGQTSVQAISQASGEKLSLQQVRVSNSAITGIGNEPNVVGAMSASRVGEVDGPMAGRLGVYIWQTNAITEFVDKESYDSDINSQNRQERSRAAGQLFNALSIKKEVVDNRVQFQ